jgi:putative transposase
MSTACYTFRLYPSPAQETVLRQSLETCREVYNSLLHWRSFAYETESISVGYSQQCAALSVWKSEHAELKAVCSQVLQNVARRVKLAVDAFFRRVKEGEKPGYPRRKGEGYDSLTYPQNGFCIGEGFVHLSKIGDVKAILHRPVRGKVKTCTVRRSAEKWFVSFACEVEYEPLPDSDESIGIDVGIQKFAALSDGTFIENPRFFKRDEQALAKAQRRKERTKKGSQAHRKAKKPVRRVHERIANRRQDFCHQTARKLVNRYGRIAVEKLNVAGMMRNAHLARSIDDAAWSLFGRVLSEKAASAGRQVIAINPAFTSQDCSGCGNRVKKTLSERRHLCYVCGLSLDRDTNAARNILNASQPLLRRLRDGVRGRYSAWKPWKHLARAVGLHSLGDRRSGRSPRFGGTP